MKVRVESYHPDQTEVELADHITNKLTSVDESGVAERASEIAEQNSQAIGVLAVKLVEAELLSLDDVKDMLGWGHRIIGFVEPTEEEQKFDSANDNN